MESDLEVDGVSEFVAAELVSATYGSVLGVAAALLLARHSRVLRGSHGSPAARVTQRVEL